MTETLTLNTEMIVVLGLLAFTVFLFVSEIVRVDVAAVLVMVILGVMTKIPALGNLGDHDLIFAGFASNAVISIIAVMIIGAGLDKTGIMSRVAAFILRIGGNTEKRVIPLVSSTVGFISSFMQNVGAAALFLPVVSRISIRTGLPMSRLLMPMGFCAILGGTVTMVGSSPLILLNDLILNSNKALPEHQQMETFGLFSVTPIGIALVIAGILYFVLAGRFVLPSRRAMSSGGESTMDYFRRVYGLDYDLHELHVPADSPLLAQTVGDLERTHRIRIIALFQSGEMRVAPARDIALLPEAQLGVLAPEAALQAFAKAGRLVPRAEIETFTEVLAATRAGISELVIPPSSTLIGRSLRDIAMRKTYGLSVLAIHRGAHTTTSGVRDFILQAGDTLVCHNTWDSLARLEHDPNFAVVTSEYPHEELRPEKLKFALVFFLIALGLVLFSDLRLSVSLMVGAVGMIATRVLTMDEAYRAVDWKTVFLLASLIPLGAAVEISGTAAWIAQQTLALLGGVPAWVLQAVIAVLATVFTLVMSNIGATVLLVPLAVNIAIGAGANPAVFALTVAIATSNSFIIPTHQVNALIMGPAGYRVKDFMKAGGVMTVLFLVVSLAMLNLIF
ncbi:MAG: SLC13 family permease [Gammaproteobacteria bacterium]|jgi:di/tricarboxylate transporter